VTDPRRDHTHYDELAAGYALHALDPAEELEFAGHVKDCPRCLQALADYGEVAAALADTAPAAEPDQHLGDRILAAAAADRSLGNGGRRAGPPVAVGGDSQAGKPPSGVASLHQHQHRRRSPRRLQLAAAAAAVLIAGGGIWAGLSGNGGTPPPPTVAGCMRVSQCHEIELTDAAGHEPAAKVIVTAGSAWLVPTGIRADDTGGHIYVLWQISGAHVPLAVGSFDVRGHGDTPIRIGKLAVPYHGTLAFAVSLERGRTIPVAPSHLVALGQVSA
jgi:hypothetical protein